MEISQNAGLRTLASYQPLNSESGAAAASLLRCSDLPRDTVEQVTQDLTALPLNWLKRFQDEHVAVVVMKTGQNLADTPLWPAFTPDLCEEMLTKAGPLVKQTVGDFLDSFKDISDPEERAYHIRMAGDDLKVKFDELSEKEELGFSVKMSREPKDYQALAAESGIDTDDSERLERWTSAFRRLNADLIEDNATQSIPHHGFYLIPYVEHKGKPYRSLSLPSLQAITGLDLSRTDGANYPDNRFLALHDSIVQATGSHMGRHRVVLHESGHMVDWICKTLPGVSETHEQKVNELYKKARAADAKAEPGTSPMLTDRAKDSAGEFFAEGVEAYLTMPVGDQFDHYKADNNRVEFEKRNPEFFNYIDYIMKL